MHKRVCKAGPFDGALAGASSDPFVYIDTDGRLHRTSAPDRVLYEYADDKTWRFAGHNAYVCTCGALVKQSTDESARKECPLCGAKRIKGNKKSA